MQAAGIGSRLSPTAYAPDHTCAYDAWYADGTMLRELDRKMGWYLGDWLNFGEAHFPDRYSQALEATELDYGTLAHYAYVSRRFPAARRRVNLSWSHHRILADVQDEGEQNDWLDRAEAEGWSVRSLADARRKPPALSVPVSQLPDALLSYLRQLPLKTVELYRSGFGTWVEQVDGPSGKLEMSMTVTSVAEQDEPAIQGSQGSGHHLSDIPERHPAAPEGVGISELLDS